MSLHLHLPEPVKKYWPFAVGGIIGLVVLMKISHGSSAAAPVDNTAAFLASQAQAGAAAASTALQTQAQQAQIDFANNQLQTQTNLAYATLSAQSAANNNDAQNAYLNNQANMALALGSSVGQIVDALNQPTIAAINGAYTTNQTALAAATSTAATGFVSQIGALKMAAGIPQTMAQMVAQTNQANASSQAATTQSNNAAATAQTQSNNNSTASTIGTIASIAAIALL